MNNPDGATSSGVIDRARLQERITAIESRVRRRLSGKFRAIARGHYDLDDVLASARRRIDHAATTHGNIPSDDDALCAYVLHVAERVAIDAARRERRQRLLRGTAAELRGQEEQALDASSARADGSCADLQVMIARLDAPDRHVVELTARGLSAAQTAAATGVSITAHRSRWRRIVARIKPQV